MESHDTTSTTPTSKPITIEVPEDRVAEFYAFAARFLAGGRGRRGGPHRHRHGHGGPRGCRPRGEERGAPEATEL